MRTDENTETLKTLKECVRDAILRHFESRARLWKLLSLESWKDSLETLLEDAFGRFFRRRQLKILHRVSGLFSSPGVGPFFPEGKEASRKLKS